MIVKNTRYKIQTKRILHRHFIKKIKNSICDPINSPECKGRNYFLKCKEEHFQCSVLKEEGIKNITVRMPKTTIPTQQTTYVHTFVELPIDGDYHLVASNPFIDNVHVVHHIDLFGCDEYNMFKGKLVSKQKGNVGETLCFPYAAYEKDYLLISTAFENENLINGPINRKLNTPVFETGWPYCSDLIAGWAVGLTGTCHEEDKAVRFGARKGYKIAVLEVHWNNPEGYSNLTDSSGMTLFYTPKLRKHDSGIIMIGQMNINIPPRLDRIAISGTCSSECTREKITGPIYITSLAHHMHQQGVYFITFMHSLFPIVVNMFASRQAQTTLSVFHKSIANSVNQTKTSIASSVNQKTEALLVMLTKRKDQKHC
ncbi:hypothetical protein KUTeg_016908 [Tegillarca granosa]|uniref:Uncharacterized protein n=1 Tax=Tegillarca granosa TaxID=220873 RepID=A0ABQ9EM93_TEGGR|nr:hypothetical protein KUTeg_016908 [Tegillarca granosa]